MAAPAVPLEVCYGPPATADFTLVASNGACFRVCSHVLSSFCGVFQRLLADMPGVRELRVEEAGPQLQARTSAAVLLDCIYRRQQLTFQTALTVLELGRKYECPVAHRQAEDFLCSDAFPLQISWAYSGREQQEGVAACLGLANEFNLQRFKGWCEQFFLDNVDRLGDSVSRGLSLQLLINRLAALPAAQLAQHRVGTLQQHKRSLDAAKGAAKR
ncbi:hypothetical protein ABPG75_011400 [Micractinium tetrahymenae]